MSLIRFFTSILFPTLVVYDIGIRAILILLILTLLVWSAIVITNLIILDIPK